MTSPNRTAGAAASLGKTGLVLRERLTPEQVDLLKKTVAKGASDDEFALFLHMCERTGLDPFAKQIYCLKRKTMNAATNQWEDAMVTQVGIDGFRLVAERTGEYMGQTVPIFYDPAGHQREVWLDSKKPPVGCKVGVLKKGFSEPLYAIALYDEYVQKKQNGEPNKQWKEKPTIMLAKCAEAMALRKAFPNDLSGVYAHEEIRDEVLDTEPTIQATAKTLPRPVGETMTAEANASGEVVLTFGVHKHKTLGAVPTAYLLETFRDPWLDEGRKATAGERLGKGFVAAVYGELTRRQVPNDMTVLVAKIIERKDAGEVLPEDDAEELRCWLADHPAPAETKAT